MLQVKLTALAVVIEVMRTIQEKRLAHGPVEFIFTTCEEIGLLGAKALEFGEIHSRTGYALDTTETDLVIIGAPTANRLTIEVTGLAAHAGLSPEKGINAIHLAAKAIAQLNLGRLDHESTANIGVIAGGTATNIVPARVTLHGEVRSHSAEKLAAFTEEIHEVFKHAVDDWTDLERNPARPELHFAVELEYPAMRLEAGAPVLTRLEDAAARLGRTLEFAVAGGGSDANIFNSRGLACAIIGTGMNKVHTTEETIDLGDMVRIAELVLATITG
jgi:tripeptide aminopeptidase